MIYSNLTEFFGCYVFAAQVQFAVDGRPESVVFARRARQFAGTNGTGDGGQYRSRSPAHDDRAEQPTSKPASRLQFVAEQRRQGRNVVISDTFLTHAPPHLHME